MHGPKVGAGRQRHKTYLIAFIDDATRVIPYAAFARGENTAAFLPVFKQALIRRGLPHRLFVDNGANYRCPARTPLSARRNIELLVPHRTQPVPDHFAGTPTPPNIEALIGVCGRRRSCDQWGLAGGEVVRDAVDRPCSRPVMKDRTVSLVESAARSTRRADPSAPTRMPASPPSSTPTPTPPSNAPGPRATWNLIAPLPSRRPRPSRSAISISSTSTSQKDN